MAKVAGIDIDSLSAKQQAALKALLEADKQEDPLAYYQPHNGQLRFHRSQASTRLVSAANRAGKTVGGIAEDLWYALGRHPYKKVATPNEGWIVSPDFPTSREVVERELFKQIPRLIDGKPWKWYKSDRILELPNGSVIGLKSADSGRDKFQGTAKRWIHFDEEPPRDVYQECIARIGAGVPLDIWLTMTAINEPSRGGRKGTGMSWVYTDLYKRRAQLPDLDVISFTLFDNPYLSDEQKAQQAAKFHGAEYRIRILGEFALMAGECVFDPESLDQLRHKFIEPEFVGMLARDNKIISRAAGKGPFRIWEPPRSDCKYFIGADVGLGTGGDPSCAEVLQFPDHKIVAEMHGNLSPQDFGQHLETFGHYYNQALIGVEANSFGIATLDAIKATYTYLYGETRFDRRTNRRTKRLGWWTTAQSKPVLIGHLAQCIKDLSIGIPAEDILDEFATYVIDSSGSTNAMDGCYDDRVIATGIAAQLYKRYAHATDSAVYLAGSPAEYLS